MVSSPSFDLAGAPIRHRLGVLRVKLMPRLMGFQTFSNSWLTHQQKNTEGVTVCSCLLYFPYIQHGFVDFLLALIFGHNHSSAVFIAKLPPWQGFAFFLQADL